MGYIKEPYTEPAISVDDILCRLESRGLSFDDKAKASHLLEHISFYRLKAYLRVFIENQTTGKFKQGSTFEDAFTLYKFDSALRKLICAELEKIEVSFRTRLSQIMSCKNDPYWFTDSSLFNNPDTHKVLLANIHTEFMRSDDEQILSFRRTYRNEFPPSWMTMEVSSFGSLSLMYKLLKCGRNKREVAKCYGISDTVLESWLLGIVYVRNICAHHGRLWNRTLRIQPLRPKKSAYPFSADTVPNNRIFFIINIIQYLLITVNPKTTFPVRLENLFSEYPTVDRRAMGFPL